MTRVEEARGGTICLEDSEALSGALQARLLTVINGQGTPPETRIIAICNGHTPDKTLEDALRRFVGRRYERCRMVVENAVQLGELEMARAPSHEQAELQRASMLALTDPI